MRQDSEPRTAEQAVPDTAPAGFWARARELAEWMEEQDSATN